MFQKHGLPIYPVVVFFHQGKVAEPDHFTVALPDITVLQFRFKVIQLARLSWRDFIQRKNPVVCALMSKMGVRPEDRVRVKLDGSLPSKMGAMLKKLTCDQLGNWAEALLDFRSKADLEAWLLQNN